MALNKETLDLDFSGIAIYLKDRIFTIKSSTIKDFTEEAVNNGLVALIDGCRGVYCRILTEQELDPFENHFSCVVEDAIGERLLDDTLDFSYLKEPFCNTYTTPDPYDDIIKELTEEDLKRITILEDKDKDKDTLSIIYIKN